VFDDVKTNLGHAYNSVTGVFTAPTPGFYVFFVNLLVFPSKTLEAELFKDVTDIMEIYSGASTSANGPGSTMIVYDIDVGSKIFVKVHENYHKTGEILNGPWCTFSDFLLYSNA
jgi:hypothetical protein